MPTLAPPQPPRRTVRKTVRLHRTQKAFRESRALYRGFVGGRGAGKSWVGNYDMIRRARRGRLYMVVAPSYKMLADSELRTFLDTARELGVVRGIDIRRSPPSVRLTTGAEILFRSADDPESLRGPNLSGVYLAEASLMPREAYDICIATLREGGEQGWLSACFTPKGFQHWTYDVFGKQQPNTELFKCRTSANPFNPAGFEDTLRQQYAPTLAMQELGGEFVDMEGAEFPSEWFAPHLWVPAMPSALSLRVIYLDPAVGKEHKEGTDKRKGDYSAFVILGRAPDGTLYVDANIDRRPMTRTIADGLDLVRRFQPLDGFGIESNAFQRLFAQEFARQAKATSIAPPLYTITNTTNKLVRIRRLTPYLMRGEIRFVDSPGTRLLVEQLRTFPIGTYDDGPDAMEGAVRLAIKLFNGRHAPGGQS